MQENGEVSKKSPQVFFAVCSYEQKIRNIFSEKRLYFEIKDLSLPLIKHNHPFFRRNAASI